MGADPSASVFLGTKLPKVMNPPIRPHDLHAPNLTLLDRKQNGGRLRHACPFFTGAKDESGAAVFDMSRRSPNPRPAATDDSSTVAAFLPGPKILSTGFDANLQVCDKVLRFEDKVGQGVKESVD